MSSVAPKAFRAALVRFAPQFKGYAQQDSQEARALSPGRPVHPSLADLDERSSAGRSA